jgi:CRISPR-associated protein Cmx8
MAKKKDAPEAVVIRYDLFDLPTAQHKAGLAGLVLSIRSLKNRSEKAPDTIPPDSVPVILEGPSNTSITIRFTERSFKGLFDDLYDADLIESDPKEKPRTKAENPGESG